MKTSDVHLKDPLLAGILAYLVPGLGHLYQRRTFKAAIYSLCIISLYLYGLSLSDWRIVQYRGGPGEPKTELLSFAAQAGVGLPGLFAINQTRRYRRARDQVVTSLREPLSSSFLGTVQVREAAGNIGGEVTGEIILDPVVGRFNEPVIVGKIIGRRSDGQEVNLSLAEGVRLGPELRNDPRRIVEADVVETNNGGETRIGRVSGSIPRSFWNWFAVPLDDAEEQALHGELGKFHELALVFTMIAGLLNILAVWDAYDGPAYGYGLATDPDQEEDDSPRKAGSSSEKPAPAGAVS